MATLSHAESRELYSWWWVSHISPKNSKWLQENLADMDFKVKSMIKLIEEDADSFRKRAEMYYRKRPELMKLVEEFYRAYRALAERYDQSTGALRQAHKTMAEAFPDQVPMMLPDESPQGPSTDVELHTPKMLSPDCPFFNMSSDSSSVKSSGIYSGTNGVAIGDETTHEHFSNGWARRVLDYQNEEENFHGDKLHQEVNQLLEENQSLKNQIAHQTEQADQAEAEARNMRETISKLNSELEAVSLQYQMSLEKISNLEADISCIRDDFKKLNDEMLVGMSKSKTVEGRCHQLEKENNSFQSELTILKKKTKKQQEELEMKRQELEKLTTSLKDECDRSKQAEMAKFSLEKLHSQTQEEVRVLRLEIHNWVEKSMNMELRKKALEEEIQRLKEEIDSLNDQTWSSALKIKRLQDEISLLVETKRKLENDVGMQLEEKKYLHQEILSLKADKMDLERRHNELMEQICIVNSNVLYLQSMLNKLQDGNMELKKLCEKHERETVEHVKRLTFMEKITEQNDRLQNEINLLVESKRKLENEVGMHVEENKYLQQEILALKADKMDLERRHNELMEQIRAVNSNVLCLHSLVSKLQDGNVELKELCEKHERERVEHLMRLTFMEKITEQNAVLENSLSSANTELEEVREKVKMLEESCEALNIKILMHTSEKAVLVSQIEAIAQNMEMLLEKNMLLENSLSDANVELGGLRGKLIAFEESCQSLLDQNSSLLVEKSTLVIQVESISNSLENLESQWRELEGKHLNLEREKDLLLHQVGELQHSLRIQKEDYETLMHSTRCQLDGLESKICVLQEKAQLKEEELEVEQYKIIHAQTEIFILQRILHDMSENNMLVSDKCQKYIETSRGQAETIFELKSESSRQQKMLKWVSQYNEKLMEGIQQVMRALDITTDCQSPDDQHFRHILLQIEDLKTSVSDAQDDNQHLALEKSVILTLLKQYGLNLAELQSRKNVLEQELKTRFEELLVLQSEWHRLLEFNKELRQNVQACNNREEVLKAEMEILSNKLSDLQEARSALQSDIMNLIEENQSFSKKINVLSERNDMLEEHNEALVAEAMKFKHLYLIFRSYNAERALELQWQSKDMEHLCGVNSGLEQEIRLLSGKLGSLEVENMSLRESLVTLAECRQLLVILEDELKIARNTFQELNYQIENGKSCLVQKDMELLQVHHDFQAAQEKTTKLSEKIEGLVMDVNEAKVEKEELEKKNFSLSEYVTCKDQEIDDLKQTNETLNRQLTKLSEEVENLKKRERGLTSELESRNQEFKSCEVETENLLHDSYTATIRAATFEEKMLELVVTCESLGISSMIQKEMFYEEITRRSVYEETLNKRLDALTGENTALKEELCAHFPLILSLAGFVTSLEQRILPLANRHSLSNEENQDSSLGHQQNGDHQALSSVGIFELQKLNAKVNTLEEVVRDIICHLEGDRHVSRITLQAAVSENDGLKTTRDLKEASAGNDIILHLKKKEETGNHKNGSAEQCKGKSEQMMKDIQLDHVLSSSQYENGTSSHVPDHIGRDGRKDQLLELWDAEDLNKLEKPSPVTSEHDVVCHQIEATEEEKNIYPSSRLAAEKELSIDKLELIMDTGSNQEWSGSISGRLTSDAQRLSVLQKSVKELKRNMETSELNDSPTSFEYKKARSQLKEAEATILQLIDTNNKLTKKADKLSSSSNSLIFEPIDGTGNTSERKISGRARRGSEKIGRLELEMQKLEYIWLKLKEENDYKKARAAERRTRILLKDYIYGKRESPRRKKVHCCACIRPRTKDE